MLHNDNVNYFFNILDRPVKTQRNLIISQDLITSRIIHRTFFLHCINKINGF